MNQSIISLQDWLGTAPGRYLLAWEQIQVDLTVADLFGFNALQLGLPELPALQANRMPYRWVALPEAVAPWTLPPAGLVTFDGGRRVDPQPNGTHQTNNPRAYTPQPLTMPRVALVTDAAALPFPAASLDLVVLPHTLELSADPHQVLREVERVLVPEGRVVICGLNPVSLWGFRQARAHLWQRMGVGQLYLPDAGAFIAPWRTRDWLRLLGFEIESERFGCYRPAVNTERWLQRTAWMDRWGARWWPILGAVYLFVAVKRVHGVRLLGPSWKPRRMPAIRSMPVARRQSPDVAD